MAISIDAKIDSKARSSDSLIWVTQDTDKPVSGSSAEAQSVANIMADLAARDSN